MTVAPNPKLVELLRSSGNMLVFTGAGISTGSGIPDYRGPQGVWTYRQPVYYQDFMASKEARVEYWDEKAEAWEAFSSAEPNAVHRAIVRLERAGKIELVVTQNIDGLHSKAGTSPGRLVEIHGTNAEIECQGCGRRSDPDPWYVEFRKSRRAPVCECGGYLKPATISFGQSLRQDDLRRSMEAAAGCDLVVSLGSTLSVQPAASVPLSAAQRGVAYIIINRGATDQDTLSEVVLRLEGDVVELFPPAVDAALDQGRLPG